MRCDLEAFPTSSLNKIWILLRTNRYISQHIGWT